MTVKKRTMKKMMEKEPDTKRFSIVHKKKGGPALPVIEEKGVSHRKKYHKR